MSAILQMILPFCRCAQSWKKVFLFMVSLKPPQIQLSEKGIDFLVFQKRNKKIIAKSLSVLMLCSFKYCFSEGN